MPRAAAAVSAGAGCSPPRCRAAPGPLPPWALCSAGASRAWRISTSRPTRPTATRPSPVRVAASGGERGFARGPALLGVPSGPPPGAARGVRSRSGCGADWGRSRRCGAAAGRGASGGTRSGGAVRDRRAVTARVCVRRGSSEYRAPCRARPEAHRRVGCSGRPAGLSVCGVICSFLSQKQPSGRSDVSLPYCTHNAVPVARDRCCVLRAVRAVMEPGFPLGLLWWQI